jgi:hypothetical protein
MPQCAVCFVDAVSFLCVFISLVIKLQRQATAKRRKDATIPCMLKKRPLFTFHCPSKQEQLKTAVLGQMDLPNKLILVMNTLFDELYQGGL